MPVIFGNPYFFSCDEIMGVMKGIPYDAETGVRTYERQFRVVTRGDTDAGRTVGVYGISTCPGLPSRGSFYVTPEGADYDLLARMAKYEVAGERKNDWGNWIVTCHYTTKHTPQKDPDKPENDTPDVGWEEEVMPYAPILDADGETILTSSRMPFSPPYTQQLGYPVLTISRNELAFSRDRADAYCFALNQKLFMGRQIGQVQCDPIRVKAKYKGTIAFWRVNYRLKFSPLILNPMFPAIPAGMDSTYFTTYPTGVGPPNLYMYRPWQPLILDQSMYRRPDKTAFVGAPALPGLFIPNPNPNTPVLIYQNHKPVNHPVLLDGKGQLAKPDATTGIIPPTFLFYETYRYLDMLDLLTKGVGGDTPPPA